MDLAGMRTAFRIYADDRDATGFPDPEVDIFINGAQEEIQGIIIEADEMFFSKCQSYDVLADPDSYQFELPADCLKLDALEKLIDGQRPIPVVWVPFSRRHEESESDRPVCYVRGTTIGVTAPHSAYTLRLWYTKRLPDLVANTDVSEIPLEHHRLVVLTAARTCALADGKDFSQWESDYQEKREKLSSMIEDRKVQESNYIHVTED